MNKKYTLILCLLLGTALLSGCSDNGENIQQKSYTADGKQVKSLNMDIRDRKIEVSLSADDHIHIDYYESDKEFYDISVSDENVLTMSAKVDKKWTDYIGGKSATGKRTILVQIPDGMLSTLELSTTNEIISLPALTVNDSILITSNGGDVSFDTLDVGKTLTIKSKNGNISGTILGSYEDFLISCEVKKGESNLPKQKNGGIKTLDISANNGDVDVEVVSK